MKKTWVKILIAALILAAAAIAAAIVLDIRANRPEQIRAYEHSINYFYADEEGATRFLVDSAVLEDRISGHVDSFLSGDGSAAVVRAGTGLYRVDKDGILLIHPAGVDRALISLDNRVIVFTTATEVHIYDHSTGKVEDIKPDSIVGVESIVLSPDGNTVGYTVKDKEGAYIAYAHENGQSKKLAESAYIMAVSDGAGFYYYIDPEDSSLWYVSDSRQRKLGTGVSSLVEFNRELTQAAFDMEGVTYYSVKGGKPKAIVSGASVYSTKAECTSLQGGEDCQAEVKDCGSIFGCVFYGFKTSSEDESARVVYDLWYVDGRVRATALARNAYKFALTDDKSRLSCLMTDNQLYIMNTGDPSSAQLVGTNVYSYNMSGDGSLFYCIGYDMGLYLVRELSAPVKIAEKAVYSVLTKDNKCLFLANYDEAGDLYITDGIKPIEAIAQDIVHVEAMPKVLFRYSAIYEDQYGKSVYDVYASEDGINWELVIKGALQTSSEE